ncbi:unnamed protein product, partial [Schistocephalus solidus]|uniref:Pecanex-like protein n=1 Tax=Schistocephalus solidus TaxID=70667 RepID=A0A183TSA1_SCHSO
HGHADRNLDNGGHFGITSISKASCKFSAPSACTHLLSPAPSVRRTVLYFTNEHSRYVSPSLYHLIENSSPEPKGPYLPAHAESVDVEDCRPIARVHQRDQTVRGREGFHGDNGDHHSYSHHCRLSSHRHFFPAQLSGREENERDYHHDKDYSALVPNVDLDSSFRNRHEALIRPVRALPPTPRDSESLEAVSTISAVRHPIWDTPEALKTSTQYLSLDL